MTDAGTIVIHDHPCPDGFGSRWVWKEAAARGLVAADHQAFAWERSMPLPATDGRHVVFLDTSVKRPLMERIIAGAASVTLIDHHQTALDELGPLMGRDGPLRGVIDIGRSACRLTWETLIPNEPAPELLRYVEDGDLYRWALPDSRLVNMAICSHPYDLAAWDRIAATPTAALAAEGAPIDRWMRRTIAEAVADTKRRMVIGGTEVRVANLPRAFISDGANMLAIGEPFAASYFDTPKGRKVSLRSADPNGADVAAIAAAYGGGGHKHAASFMAPAGWEGDTAC